MQTFYPWLRRLLPLLLPALALVGIGWYQRPDGRLHIIFVPTAGDAALVQTPGGSFVLIDGGSDASTLATLIARRMPFWQRDLAAVILTAPRRSWLPGQVAALARYRTAVAFAPPVPSKSPVFAEWRRLLADTGTPIRIAKAGSRIAVDDIALTVIDPGDGDATGLTLRLDYKNTGILFDSAAGDDENSRLGDMNRPVQAVVVPWQQALPEDLLTRTHPRILVFTDGIQLKRPAELTTLDRAIGGAAVYHEAINGAIELISDGTHLIVKTDQ